MFWNQIVLTPIEFTPEEERLIDELWAGIVRKAEAERTAAPIVLNVDGDELA